MTHRPKKSLGQHFLRSASAIKAIVSSGDVTAADTVLEIGPGEGVLTAAILETGAKVIAVEFDHALIPILTERFAKEIETKQFTLVESDVLKWYPKDAGLFAGKYKLVANIPYYITGAIFEKFLTEKNPPSCMVVLIQKEVATRIVARDKKESILSLSVKAFGVPKLTAKVPASAFRPAPKVDSAVLAVSDISQKNFSGWNCSPDEAGKHFFDVVHAAFAHKRKLLLRNLEATAEKETIARAFSELSLSPNARAEDLPLDTWMPLVRILKDK